MCGSAWISKYLGGLGITQALISSLTKDAWQHETRKSLWSNIGRLYTFARNQRQPGLVLGEFIQAELIRNHEDPSPRNFLLTCGVNVDDMRGDKPEKETYLPGKIEFFEPFPVETASDVHFTPPPGTEISDTEALGYAAEASPPHNQEYIMAYSATGEPPHWQVDRHTGDWVDGYRPMETGNQVEEQTNSVTLKQKNKIYCRKNSQMGNPVLDKARAYWDLTKEREQGNYETQDVKREGYPFRLTN